MEQYICIRERERERERESLDSVKVNSYLSLPLNSISGPSEKCLFKLEELQVLPGGVVNLCPNKEYHLTDGIIINQPTILNGNGARLMGPGINTDSIAITILSDQVTIQNLKIAEFGKGIYAGTMTSPSLQDIILKDNTFIELNTHVRLYAKDSNIKDNQFIISFGEDLAPFAIYILDPENDFVENVIIEGNTLKFLPRTNEYMFLEGILISGFNQMKNIRVRDNLIIHHPPPACGKGWACMGPGIGMVNVINSKISNNEILNSGMGSVIYTEGMAGNTIENNKISGLRSSKIRGVGIRVGSASINSNFESNIIKNNYVSRNAPVNNQDKYTSGYYDFDFWFSGSWGGSIITENTFENLDESWFIGTVYPDPRTKQIILEKNNFINSPITSDMLGRGNAPAQSLFNNNYFSDHMGIACDSDSNGFCQNPYGWYPYINQDEQPKASPW